MKLHENVKGSEALRKAYRYRWIVWGSMVLAYMVVFFHRLAAGVVKEDIINTFGLSYTEFGNLASMYFYAYMIMQVPVGILADTLGARITVSTGMLVAAVGSVVFGLAKSVFAVFLGRFLVGIGVSVVFVCVLKVQSQWFREDEFASVSGATSLIGNLGGLVAQTPLAVMVAAFTWRYTFVGIGALSAALAIMCFVLIRNKPQDMGFPPIHENGSLEENKKVSITSGLMEVVKDIHLWPCFLYVPLVAGAYIAFTGAWGVPFLSEVYGMSAKEASGFIIMAVLGAMLGGVFMGWVSDKLKMRKLPVVLVSVAQVLSWAGIVFLAGKPINGILLKGLFFVMGFTSMGVVVTWAIIKEMSHPERTGVAISVMNMITFLGLAIYPPLMGKIIDIFKASGPAYAYRSAFMFCLLATAVALGLIFLAKETGCKNIYATRKGLKN